MSVAGDCACLGVSGTILERDWVQEEVIEYTSHNVDTRQQAYDLLAVFTYWVETVEAFKGWRSGRSGIGCWWR
jgi:hypothetical protein